MTRNELKEKQFEDHIEQELLTHAGYHRGDARRYDRGSALDERELFSFLRETQPKEWRRLEKICPGRAADEFLRALETSITSQGMLHTLRKGVRVRSSQFTLIYWRPSSRLNAHTQQAYEANRFAVVRQLFFSRDSKKSIDLVLFINGIPLVSIELKNQFTRQDISHGIAQYRFTRSPEEKLFRFNTRVLVHFALDHDRVAMCTKLEGAQSYFLPFNQGSAGAGRVGGEGNPPPTAAQGFSTSYLWREVLQRDSLLEILQYFMQLTGRDTDAMSGRKLIFPRYHQLHAVRALLAHAQAHGSGVNYLIEHSAGSGKSNSIAWLAHRLANLHDAQDEKIFASVLVLTDRRVLDSQLRAIIASFDHDRGVMRQVRRSSELAEALNHRVPIIVSTVQKFPHIVEAVRFHPSRFAVIVDEAHSSTAGKLAAAMKEILADKRAALDEWHDEWRDVEEEDDGDDGKDVGEVDRVMDELAAQGQHANLSFFAFTATPKPKTLELFGSRQADGSYRHFHCYSMRQAIEEGFILDVLRNYMSYKCYFEISSSADAEQLVSCKAANRELGCYTSLHPYNIAQKVGVVLSYYMSRTRHQIGGRGKAMLVCGSREHALSYAQELRRQVRERGYGIGVLVAFSGELTVQGQTYTESQLNSYPSGESIPEAQLPAAFASDDFHILVVAEKYQTGFDQPLLHTMFVDKKLNGIATVQTLSRLNRTASGKRDCFVLDFVNEPEDIQADFNTYYESTHLIEGIDVQSLHTRRLELDKFHVYHAREIAAFAALYTEGKLERSSHMAEAAALLHPAASHYRALPDEAQRDFRGKLGAYVRSYDFISQVIRLFDREQHEFTIYARYLLRILSSERVESLDLREFLTLEYYRLEQQAERSLSLGADDGGLAHKKGDGTPREEELSPLAELLDEFNKRWKTSFTKDDIVFVARLISPLERQEGLRNFAQTNTEAMFYREYEKEFTKVFIEAMQSGNEFFSLLMNNPEAYERTCRHIGAQLFRQFTTEKPSPAGVSSAS